MIWETDVNDEDRWESELEIVLGNDQEKQSVSTQVRQEIEEKDCVFEMTFDDWANEATIAFVIVMLELVIVVKAGLIVAEMKKIESLEEPVSTIEVVRELVAGG